MDFTEKSCREFTELLASSAPVPGGGGASALAGAIGMALGNMVGSLTVGKKKYAAVESDILRLNEEAQRLRKELLSMVERDAEAFAPLAQAYSLPKETPEQKAYKAKVMDQVLKDACSVPMEIMKTCCQSIRLIEKYTEIGASIAISDAGVAVALCRSALLGASLNVLINAKAMTDRAYAMHLTAELDEMLDRYVPMADQIYQQVADSLR